MDDREIRAALERRYANITDQEEVHELYADDVIFELPQGKERIVGLANLRAMREAYPAQVEITPTRIRGSGPLWVIEVLISYDGGAPMHAVNLMEFRQGKIVHEAIYFGDPWQAPAWRAQWVEPMA